MNSIPNPNAPVLRGIGWRVASACAVIVAVVLVAVVWSSRARGAETGYWYLDGRHFFAPASDPCTSSAIDGHVTWKCTASVGECVETLVWVPNSNAGPTLTPVVHWRANTTDNTENVCWEVMATAYPATSDFDTEAWGTPSVGLTTPSTTANELLIDTTIAAMTIYNQAASADCSASTCNNHLTRLRVCATSECPATIMSLPDAEFMGVALQWTTN